MLALFWDNTQVFAVFCEGLHIAGTPVLSWQACSLAAMAALTGFTAFQESKLNPDNLKDALKHRADDPGSNK